LGEPCQEIVCDEDEFLCTDLTECTHVDNVCDEIFDCLDGSDEYNCSELAWDITNYQREYIDLQISKYSYQITF
jgi:hypothetical protein